MPGVHRLSMWTSYYYDVPPEAALEEIAACGWAAAELSEEHGVTLLERGPDAGAAFRRAARDTGVLLAQGHLDLAADIAADSKTARRETLESVKRRIDLFLDVGVVAAVLHPGGGRIADADRRRELNLAALAELTEYAEGTDLVICLENCCSGLDLAPLLAATPPEAVGVCLDTGHLNLTKEDPATLIRQWGRRLRALHVSDNDGTGDQHRNPGTSGCTVNWPPLAAALAEVGYEGLVNFELPGENRCPIEQRREKMQALKTRAEELFAAVLAR